MDYQALKTELTTDPLVRGYSGMSDEAAASDLNTEYRTNTSLDIAQALKFLLLDNTYKINDGTDTQDRSIWQRLKEVASLATVPSAAVANPWGSSSLGNITEIQQIKTHQLLDLFTLSAQGDLSVDLTDSNFQVYLAGAESAGCMSTTQETDLLALDKISRGRELGFGRVRVGYVEFARNLT